MEDMKKRETSEVKGSVSVSHHPLSLITQELMYTKVQVMENPKCRDWFENESKLLDEKWGFGKGDWPPIVNITENQLCSGDAQTRTGACYGDSGKNFKTIYHTSGGKLHRAAFQEGLLLSKTCPMC